MKNTTISIESKFLECDSYGQFVADIINVISSPLDRLRRYSGDQNTEYFHNNSLHDERVTRPDAVSIFQSYEATLNTLN